MADKVLSVVIPTYNTGKFLPRCLDSIVSCSGSEYLDVLVVNDGSTDDSLSAAGRYEQDYPGIITIIDKPNGGYGSAINAALPIAKGVYFRILDSDDQFETEALGRLIGELRGLESDMVVTHFTQLGPGRSREVIRYDTFGRNWYEYGKIHALDDVLKDGHIRFFLMHSLTYRTDFLRRMNYRQSEGLSHTDLEFATYPVFHAETIVFLNLNLYRYYLGREGQTMDTAIMCKRIEQIEKVTDRMIGYYRGFDLCSISPARRKYMEQYYLNRLRILFKHYLLDLPRRDFIPSDFERVFRKYEPFIQDIGLELHLYPENKIIRIDYISYWNHHRRRWPVWLEKFNHLVDVAVKFLYVILFRR